MGRDNAEKRKMGLIRAKLDKALPDSTGVDWAAVDHNTLIELITVITSRGGAVRLGYTRDGGAYAVGLYYGSEHETKYIRPSEDANSRIRDFIDAFQDLPNTGGKAPE